MTARKERLSDKAQIENWSFYDIVSLVPREEYHSHADGYIALAQQVRERMGDRDYEYSEAAVKEMIRSCGGTLDGHQNNLNFTYLDHGRK